MPVLLRRSHAARHALTWRCSSRLHSAAPLHPLLAKPIAAVRHIFRDHSAEPHNPAGDVGSARQRQHHPNARRPHSHHRKGHELSSDWPSLYLASKLAYWSGLCYYPYETLVRTLEEEGLQLVAYGRTSYTCWYVADGCVDFEALTRRAFPKRHTPRTHDAGSDGGGGGGTSTGTIDSGGGSGTTGPAVGTALPNTAAGKGEGENVPRQLSARLGPGAAEGTAPAPPAGPHRPPAAADPSSLSSPAEAAAGRAVGGGQQHGGEGPHGRHGSGHGHGHVHGHGHGDGHGRTGASGHNHHHHDHHALRDGHLHLHHKPPPLHLHRPATAPRPDPHGSDGVGGGAGASGRGPHAGTPEVGPGAGGGCGGIGPGTRCRFVFLRGVQWGAHDSNTLSLSASLASFWPTPLLPPSDAAAAPTKDHAVAPLGDGDRGEPAGSRSSTGGGAGGGAGGGVDGALPSLGELVAHSGVASLARELLPVLLPHVRGAAASGSEQLVFAGHSLGGSLAKLVWALAVLRGHCSPSASCVHTFGSPPVLAHASGGGGGRVLRVLRAPPCGVVNWALQHDPVPRAMLTADPYFAAARSSLPGLSALLSLRGALLGEGAALSSGRFLYETVGELLLLRWAAKGGCEVVPVSEAEGEELLRMALDEAMSAPVRSLQYWLDHHHASYHHDLEAAALAACRRQARSRQGEQGP